MIILLYFLFSLNANQSTYIVKTGDSISKVLKDKHIAPLYGQNGSLIKAIELNSNLNDPNKIYPGQTILLPNLKGSQKNINSAYSTPSLEKFKESYMLIPENKYQQTNKKLNNMGLKTDLIGVDWDKNKDRLMYKVLVIKDNKQQAKQVIKMNEEKYQEEIEEVEEKKEINAKGIKNNDNSKLITDDTSKNTETEDSNSTDFFEYSVAGTLGAEVLFSTDSSSNNAVLWTAFNPGIDLEFNLNISKNFKILSDIELFYNNYREPQDPVVTPLTQDKKLLYNFAIGLAYKAFGENYIFLKAGMRSFHYIYGSAASLTVDRMNIFYSSLGAKIKWTETQDYILSSDLFASIIFPKTTNGFNTKMGFGAGGSFKYSMKMTENFNLFSSINLDFNNLNPEITHLSVIRTYFAVGIEGSF